ncbi:hypothetical protein [Flavobacterium sp.]|uniref:hypothetical protein n=1 Tax=Flavobacterium sp. TaxID=239 RepID=UPI00375080C2
MEENKKPENPSVYPDPMRGAEQSCSNQNPWQLESGMTLRDYFAAKAMQYFISANNGNFSENDASQIFYIADAMLKQREL